MTHIKTALVVGAGRGSGLAIAKLLAQRCDILLLTEVEDRYSMLKYEAAGIVSSGTAKVECFTLDIRNIYEINSLFAQLEANGVILNYLVCNAGVNILQKAIEVTPETWDCVMDVNLRGAFFVMQGAAKSMLLNDGGGMVAIASQHGTVANYDRSPYCASKAGLIHMAKSLALEWSQHKIRVNVVSPTYILYEENKDLLLSPKGIREYQNSIPLNQYCRAEDVANAVDFLLSDKAALITGHNLIVDGGYTIK